MTTAIRIAARGEGRPDASNDEGQSRVSLSFHAGHEDSGMNRLLCLTLALAGVAAPAFSQSLPPFGPVRAVALGMSSRQSRSLRGPLAEGESSRRYLVPERPESGRSRLSLPGRAYQFAAAPGSSPSARSPNCPTAAVGKLRERVVPATAGHPSCQRSASPTTGFKVQPTYADGRSNGTILQCGRSRSCWSGRHPMHPIRQQCDQRNWRCRPNPDQHSGSEPSFDWRLSKPMVPRTASLIADLRSQTSPCRLRGTPRQGWHRFRHGGLGGNSALPHPN
jgi:hypothetical protein